MKLSTLIGVYTLPLFTAAINPHQIRELMGKHHEKFEVKTFPSTPVNGSVTADFSSSDTFGLDSPKISGVNAESWDWWYFDAISPDLEMEIAIVFFTALSSGFPSIPTYPSPNAISLWATFSNGSFFSATLDADSATIVSVGQGSSGDWKKEGEKWGWKGEPDLSRYRIEIDSPSHGVKGSFELKSTAPGHYPCGPVGKGETLEVGPRIGWSNAVPDADGSVDFLFNGEKFAFEGVAYHDKNWSDEIFVQNLASWFWGHGRIGPYAIVWFDFLAPNGTEYVSAYASRDHKIITASCTTNSIKVRPIGANDAYPPIPTSGPPGGFNIVLDLGAEGVLNVNFTTFSVPIGVVTDYYRMLGNLTGGIEGGEVLVPGAALCEEFKLL